MKVVSYRARFNPLSGIGFIQLRLENGSTPNLNNLSADKYNAVYNTLQHAPVFWNGTWLSIHEPVTD